MKKGTIIKVTFSEPTKVKLMSSYNFKKYKKGKTHNYYGGHYDNSPIEFVIPADGHYNCVIEKGSFNNPKDVTGDVVIAGMAKRKRKIEAAPEAAEAPVEGAAEAQTEESAEATAEAEAPVEDLADTPAQDEAPAEPEAESVAESTEPAVEGENTAVDENGGDEEEREA